MLQMTALSRFIVLGCCVGMVGGCVPSVPNGDGVALEDVHDPLESVNRISFSLNRNFDKSFFRPTAAVYKDKVPEPAQECIGNISSNLKEPVRVIGHALTGEVEDSLVSGMRFIFNTFMGGFGCLDVAESMKVTKRDTDIGLALRARSGPKQIFIVLPFFGPSSLLDGVGTASSKFILPFTATIPKREGGFSNAFEDLGKFNPYETADDKRLGFYFTGLAVHERAELLDTTDFLDDAALDPYLFWRDAYLEQRAGLAAEIRENFRR